MLTLGLFPRATLRWLAAACDAGATDGSLVVCHTSINLASGPYLSVFAISLCFCSPERFGLGCIHLQFPPSSVLGLNRSYILIAD